MLQPLRCNCVLSPGHRPESDAKLLGKPSSSAPKAPQPQGIQAAALRGGAGRQESLRLGTVLQRGRFTSLHPLCCCLQIVPKVPLVLWRCPHGSAFFPWGGHKGLQ